MELTLELPDIGLVPVALRHMNARYNVPGRELRGRPLKVESYYQLKV
jgi:hypothetical protein